MTSSSAVSAGHVPAGAGPHTRIGEPARGHWVDMSQSDPERNDEPDQDAEPPGDGVHAPGPNRGPDPDPEPGTAE